MTKFTKIVFLSVIAVGLLAGPAMAALLYNSQGAAFGTGGVTTTSYRVAYEIYNEALGVSTIADRGAIRIDLTQPLVAQDTANLVISSGNADFNSAGPNFKWGLWYDANLNGIIEAGEIIGFTPSAGLIAANLPFAIATTVNPPASIRVIQWEDTGATVNDFDAGEVVVNGAGLYVRPGLGATCTTKPIVKLGFTTPRETTPEPVNFAFITPQFGGTGPATSALTAELNTDDDFRTFLEGSGPNVDGPFTIDVLGFFNITDSAIESLMWIAYAPISPEGNFAFKVNSAVGESATDIWFNDIHCTANADSTVFSCANTAISLVGAHDLFLEVDGGINQPTNWSLADVAISVTTAGLKELCVAFPTQSIGVWYGGLEAFIPFVKGTTDGQYGTFIKLFNRYSKDAPVYVSTFKDTVGNNPIMVSTGQIVGKEVIPSDGFLTITHQDIQDFLGSDWNMADGIPVKLNIRVPSQIGTTTATGILFEGFIFDGTITNVNPFDPYVEGVVISSYPGNGQRTIPLKFKSFKQGMYNQ